MAGNKRPGRKAAKNEVAASLLKALAFLTAATKAPTTTSLPFVGHVFINAGNAIAFDGVVAAGHPVDNSIAGYPNTRLLVEALENTGKEFNLTVRENGAFEITSDKYQSLVPALPNGDVIPTYPDQNVYGLNATVSTALVAVGKIVSDTADKMVNASVRFAGPSFMATDGATILEAYHGFALPPGVLVPKAFVNAVDKVGKEPSGFGMSANWETITFWYPDGSWIRTNTFKDDANGKADWPEGMMRVYASIMTAPMNNETPADLFTAVERVLPFAEQDRRVIVRPGLVRTHPDRRHGAALEVPAVTTEFDIDGKRLMAVQEFAKFFGLFPGKAFCFFNGASVRGAIVIKEPLPDPKPEAPPAPAVGGWITGGQPSPQTAQQPQGASPWGQPSAPMFVQPAEAAAPPPTQQAQPQTGGWPGGPETGIAQTQEFQEGANFGSNGTGQFNHGQTAQTQVFDPQAAGNGGGVDFSGGFDSNAWLSGVGPDMGEDGDND